MDSHVGVDTLTIAQASDRGLRVELTNGKRSDGLTRSESATSIKICNSIRNRSDNMPPAIPLVSFPSTDHSRKVLRDRDGSQEISSYLKSATDCSKQKAIVARG